MGASEGTVTCARPWRPPTPRRDLDCRTSLVLWIGHCYTAHPADAPARQHSSTRIGPSSGALRLFGSRLAYLYAVLFDPDLILSYIDDRWLARQVEADNLANSSALFLCAAAIEAAVKDRTFGDTPSNTLASYLRSEFKKRGWLWPSSPFVWKLHFLKHYVEALF